MIQALDDNDWKQHLQRQHALMLRLLAESAPSLICYTCEENETWQDDEYAMIYDDD